MKRLAQTVRLAYTGPRALQVQPGICRTGLHIFHGETDARVHPPGVIGHEMSGQIAELGNTAGGWQVGDLVTVVPLGRGPGCQAGHTHLCHRHPRGLPLRDLAPRVQPRSESLAKFSFPSGATWPATGQSA